MGFKIETLWSTICIICVHIYFTLKAFVRLVPTGLSPQWSLVCDAASEVHIAKFALLVGSSFGYLVFGILADW